MDEIVVRRSWFFIMLAAIVLRPCLTAEPEKPLSALPPEGFSFNGTWDCAGLIGNKRSHKAIFTGSVVLAGKWLELDEQDVEPASGYVGKYLIGYDALQKRLVEFDANNFGAAIYFSTDGWQNHALTMTSPISEGGGSPYAANRFVYSVTGSNGFTVDWQTSKTATLDWVTSDHLACNRQKGSN